MKYILPHGFRFRLLLAAIALTVIGCGETATPVAPRPTRSEPRATTRVADENPFRIAFLGDSLSAGLGLTESEAFPALVQQQLRQRGFAVEVTNAGVSGDTTAGGLSRIMPFLHQRVRFPDLSHLPQKGTQHP